MNINGGIRLTFHEYFHTVEKALGLDSQDWPSAKKKYYPNWSPERCDDWCYWEYMLSTYIPKNFRGLKGNTARRPWDRILYHTLYPMDMTPETYEYNVKAVAKISSADLKKAYELGGYAADALGGNDLKRATALFRSVYRLNPAHHGAVRFFADRAREEGDFATAVKMYSEHFFLSDDGGSAALAGSILAGRMKKYRESAAWYERAERASRSPAGRARTDKEAGWAFLQEGQYDTAISFFERGAKIDTKDIPAECRFFKGECLFRSGRRDEGEKIMRRALDDGLKANAWFVSRLKLLSALDNKRENGH